LTYEISNQGYRPMTFTVLRNGEEVLLENVIVPSFIDSGATFGNMDFRVYAEPEFDFKTVLKHTWYRSVSTVKMVFDSLFGLFSGRYGVEAVSGPVGITKTISDVAKMGWLNLLHLVTVISINLGVMNLLPFPALDGGHLLIYVIEAIRRKPLKREVEGMINFIGLVIILTLAVLIMIKDFIAL
jgi:regulator of sigma E protease